MGSEMVSVDGVLHVRCPRCGFLNLTGVCACSYKPTPPAPAMPDEVRALVTDAEANVRILESTGLTRAAEATRQRIAAVEAKYGGSR